MIQGNSKHNSKKRMWVIGVIVTLVVIALGSGGWVLYQDYARKNAAKDHLAQVKRQEPNTKLTTQTVDGVPVHIFAPVVQGHAVSLPESVTTAAKAAVKKLPKGQERAVYVQFGSQKAVYGLKAMVPELTGYVLDGTQFKRVSRSQAPGWTVKATTGKPAVAGDVFEEDGDRRAINQLARQVLVTGKRYAEAQVKTALALPLLQNQQATNFTVSNKGLNIALGQNDLDVKQVTVATKQLQPFLKPPYRKVQPAASGKVVALTFDDGPNPDTTPKVLKTLADNNIKATFFMVGTALDAYPDTAKLLREGHHELAEHTYNHKFLPKLGTAGAKAEVEQAEIAFYKNFNTLPMLLRPPYGAIDSQSGAGIDMPAIQWTVDSRDWTLKDSGALANHVVAATQDGGIVLMHDTHPQTAAALPAIVAGLKAKGYQFVTVSELLGDRLVPGRQYFGRGDERSDAK